MAVQKLRNYDSKHTFKDTKIFGQIDPGKTPVWGKPVREREFFLFLQILEITSAKNKTNNKYLSLPSFSVLEIYRKKRNSCNLEIRAQTVVPYGLYGLLENRAQILMQLYSGRTDCTDH